MCLLIILREVVPEWPLVVAANREERFARPSASPGLLARNPAVFGGRDLQCGGTWLAVNQWGMVCAVTNRPRKGPPPAATRSRGLLCLEAAGQRSPITVADYLGRAVTENAYEGFNLVCATSTLANAFYYNGTLREKPLGPGVVVLTTGDANDMSSAKTQRVRERIGDDLARPMTAWIDRLEAICRDHGADPAGPEALCVHRGEAGTVSSSIIAINAENARMHLFRHAAGPPCTTPYYTLEWPYGFFEATLPPPTAYSAAD
jgi:uncharacterized protein with NRDE domain